MANKGLTFKEFSEKLKSGGYTNLRGAKIAVGRAKWSPADTKAASAQVDDYFQRGAAKAAAKPAAKPAPAKTPVPAKAFLEDDEEEDDVKEEAPAPAKAPRAKKATKAGTQEVLDVANVNSLKTTWSKVLDTTQFGAVHKLAQLNSVMAIYQQLHQLGIDVSEATAVLPVLADIVAKMLPAPKVEVAASVKAVEPTAAPSEEQEETLPATFLEEAGQDELASHQFVTYRSPIFSLEEVGFSSMYTSPCSLFCICQLLTPFLVSRIQLRKPSCLVITSSANDGCAFRILLRIFLCTPVSSGSTVANILCSPDSGQKKAR